MFEQNLGTAVIGVVPGFYYMPEGASFMCENDIRPVLSLDVQTVYTTDVPADNCEIGDFHKLESAVCCEWCF